jgi:hypothetical protein
MLPNSFKIWMDEKWYGPLLVMIGGAAMGFAWYLLLDNEEYGNKVVNTLLNGAESINPFKQFNTTDWSNPLPEIENKVHIPEDQRIWGDGK